MASSRQVARGIRPNGRAEQPIERLAAGVLVPACPDDDVRALALNDGVVCYLRKPIDEKHLTRCLRTALHRAGADNDAQLYALAFSLGRPVCLRLAVSRPCRARLSRAVRRAGRSPRAADRAQRRHLSVRPIPSARRTDPRLVGDTIRKHELLLRADSKRSVAALYARLPAGCRCSVDVRSPPRLCENSGREIPYSRAKQEFFQFFSLCGAIGLEIVGSPEVRENGITVRAGLQCFGADQST